MFLVYIISRVIKTPFWWIEIDSFFLWYNDENNHHLDMTLTLMAGACAIIWWLFGFWYFIGVLSVLFLSVMAFVTIQWRSAKKLFKEQEENER